MSKRTLLWLLPILFMAILTPFTPALDFNIAHWIYTSETTGLLASAPNSFASTDFTRFFYRYGLFPAQATCGIAGLFFLYTYKNQKLKAYRQGAFAIALSMGIGSGIVTGILFKEFWGRPRPKQVVEFGGTLKFRPYYAPSFKTTSEPAKSFPSGHATCGFYFFIFYLIGKRYHNKTLAAAGLFTALLLGALLSVTRIFQGGHFLSDVLFAALIMWESAIFSDWLAFDCKKVVTKLTQ